MADFVLDEADFSRLAPLLERARLLWPHRLSDSDAWENLRERLRMAAACVEPTQRIHLARAAALLWEAEHGTCLSPGESRKIPCAVPKDDQPRVTRCAALHAAEMYAAESLLMCLLPLVREAALLDFAEWLDTSLMVMMSVRRMLQSAPQ